MSSIIHQSSSSSLINRHAQAGDVVWEVEGVVPLAGMLDTRDPEQFKAAASAIAALANAKNRAFQVRALKCLCPPYTCATADAYWTGRP